MVRGCAAPYCANAGPVAATTARNSTEFAAKQHFELRIFMPCFSFRNRFRREESGTYKANMYSQKSTIQEPGKVLHTCGNPLMREWLWRCIVFQV
jgi:hypothetical protein